MRIVSMLPACTEWVVAFGGLCDLVGRSHACDYPPKISALPVVTRPRIRDQRPRDIDTGIRQRIEAGLSPFDIDLDMLVGLQPDLILTQTQCAVCAISEDDLLDGITQTMRPTPELFSFHANTMKEVVSRALALGRIVGRMDAAMNTIGAMERQLRRVRERLGLQRTTSDAERPSVVAVEWVDPLMSAGHWTPDLIELAGGRAVCAASGVRSKEIAWERLRAEDADILTLVSCGMKLDAAVRAANSLEKHEGWDELAAVRNGRVFVFDGSAYFNRPGPRLYRSIELLAAAIHGERAGIETRAGEMIRLRS